MIAPGYDYHIEFHLFLFGKALQNAEYTIPECLVIQNIFRMEQSSRKSIAMLLRSKLAYSVPYSTAGTRMTEIAAQPTEFSLPQDQIKNIIEAALLASGQSLTIDRMLALFTDEPVPPMREQIHQALAKLDQEYSGRGIELRETGSGFRLQVLATLAPWIGKLWEERPQRYSRALLETLAIIAYRQPITRGEIENVRGVAVSSSIMKTLQEREWIRIVGHRDVPGKPGLYATTRHFLDHFNLKNLNDLPTLAELRDLDEISAELEQSSTTPTDEGIQSVSTSETGVLQSGQTSMDERIYSEEKLPE